MHALWILSNAVGNWLFSISVTMLGCTCLTGAGRTRKIETLERFGKSGRRFEKSGRSDFSKRFIHTSGIPSNAEGAFEKGTCFAMQTILSLVKSFSKTSPPFSRWNEAICSSIWSKKRRYVV